MSDIAIRVEHLSKRYRLGQREQAAYRTLREAVSDVLLSPLRRFRTAAQRANVPTGQRENGYIWALRDVSFEVKRGEVIGIIGRNGAGKTTLLKILSRITEPTEGYAEIHGRVGSLLEVGTGFHPELTGRENIYLSGAILGMKKAEIDRYFDEIVEFAEIEKFLDTPVKRYSSGMYVRLAFAVAAHLQPEILLVDEVLAVGDAAFQKKCLGKMGDVAREGRTVLFVSHNMGAVSSLTQKCIYMYKGRIATFAETKRVVEQYLRDTIQFRNVASHSFDFYRRDLNPDSPVRISNIWAVSEHGQATSTIQMGKSFTIYVEVDAFQKVQGANLTIILKNVRGEHVVVIFSEDQDFYLYFSPGKYVIVANIKNLCLAPGQYLADIGINQSSQTRAYEVIVDFPIFSVVNDGKIVHWVERPWGAVHCDTISWVVEKRIPSKDSG